MKTIKIDNELIGTIEEPISTEQAKELGVVIELDEINVDNQ